MSSAASSIPTNVKKSVEKKSSQLSKQAKTLVAMDSYNAKVGIGD